MQMEDNEIASLVPGGRALPMKVRVLRKWNPAYRDTQTCYIFVDKQGNAVQANVKGSEQKVVDARLRLGSCYLMKNYGCGDIDNYSNTLSHSTNLVIGGATSFTLLPDTGEIPTEYFDFASRRRMEAACDKDNETIDYIGILVDCQEKLTKNKRPYLLLTIKDCSNEYINVTLWEEIATSLTRYNKPAIQAAVDPKIIAMTALKVKKYNRLKLQSSNATYVYLNPTTMEASKLLQIYDNHISTNPSSNQELYLLNASSECVVTIEDILNKQSTELAGKTYIVDGEISNILNKEWCYIACPKCNKDLTRADTEWFCAKDNLINDPIYSFRFTAVISDGTGSLDATIFNDAAVQLLGVPCNTIVESDDQIDLKRIPPLLEANIGKNGKFYLRAHRNERARTTRCTIDKIIPVTTEPTSKMQPPSLKAPITPQPKQTLLLQKPSSTVKRQLQLDEDVAAETSKKVKGTM